MSGAKVASVLLALTGIAIVSIQTYVFINYKEFSNSYGPFPLYNGVALASGSVSCLTAIFCLCCTSSTSSLAFSVFMAVLAAVGSAASAAMSAIESSRIRSNDAEHPCTLTADDPSVSVDCDLWFTLEISVAALSVFSFILSLILTIVISVTLSKFKKEIKRSNDRQPDRPIVHEMEHIQSPVIVMPVIVEQPEQIEPEIESESEPVVEPEPEIVNTINNSRQPYIEQLKMMSREELERRLGEHMQQQFLEELRSELNRRNLIPINGRQISISRSTSGSTKSGHRESSSAVVPRPDYYVQESL